jgi:hypothetical protein
VLVCDALALAADVSSERLERHCRENKSKELD